MWWLQGSFRGRVRYEVDEALAGIGLVVRPHVVLVAFAVGSREGHEVRVEPEDGPLDASALSSVQERATALYDSGSASRVPLTGPRQRKWYHDRRWLVMRGKVLVEAIEASGAFPSTTFFASESACVGGYEVHTCVGVPASILESLPAFDEGEINGAHVGRSLQHEVVAECLRRADASLYLPDPVGGLVSYGGSRNIIRAAADRLLDGTVFRQGGFGMELFDTLNEITFLGYERRQAAGRLLVTSSVSPRKLAEVEFDKPVALRDVRLVRKVLELSDESTALLADADAVYGLVGGIVPSDTLEIRVQGQSRWEVRYGEMPLMRVSNGGAVLSTPAVDRDEFVDIAKRTVGDIDVEPIWAIIEEAQRSGHGVTLVISHDPAAEAGRLGGQAVAIRPRFLDSTDVVRLGRVDGAVIVGPDARCYAFGVILDGVATEAHGNPARGSRFNSAIRYQRTQAQESLLVVISDDGRRNGAVFRGAHYPATETENPPEAMSRVLGAAVDMFRGAVPAPPQGPTSSDGGHDGESASTCFAAHAPPHHATLDDRLVQSLAFYLTAEQCNSVNASWEAEMRRRMQARSSTAFTAPLRAPLLPHPDMDSSYWL